MIALALASLAHAASGVFVLGVDGMDPVILGRLIQEGKTPNLARLAAEGSFMPLQTINPPQSPVAWSSFVTGLDPSGHGIFDFIHRDPATYHPISSATPPSTEAPTVLRLFGYVLPLSGGSSENNRSGLPFWDLLDAAGVPVEVYRIPGNFPVPTSEAKVLSGMGTPDMRGGYGTYSLFTDHPPSGSLKGDIQRVSVADLDLDGRPDTVSANLKGAPDVLHLEPGQIPRDRDYLTARVTMSLDPDRKAVAVRLDDQVVLLHPGEWGPWMTVTFDAAPWGLMPIEGVVRFYAKELSPGFAVYASPVNMSPAAPAMPVSSPDDWAADLAERVGTFYTQGMPEDTSALRDGVFTDDEYLAQVALVQEETRAFAHEATSGFEPGGFTFLYVSDIDLQSHMLWRHGDPKDPAAAPHPAYDPATGPAHAHDIERFYGDVDTLVGEVQAQLPAGTVLMIMSDHGFQSYHTQVHLNAWLAQQGYLVLKSGHATGSISDDDVDWTKTRAYGLGFNGLYLNRVGRERDGIVTDAQAPALVAELRERLLGLTTPETGVHAVRSVVDTASAWKGARRAEGPDLLVGYDAGFGCSDASTLGKVGREVFEPNREAWSGNHLMAPEVVPGVLLVNRKLTGSGYGLTDLTATLIDHFGAERPADLVGKPFSLD